MEQKKHCNFSQSSSGSGEGSWRAKSNESKSEKNLRNMLGVRKTAEEDLKLKGLVLCKTQVTCSNNNNIIMCL